MYYLLNVLPSQCITFSPRVLPSHQGYYLLTKGITFSRVLSSQWYYLLNGITFSMYYLLTKGITFSRVLFSEMYYLLKGITFSRFYLLKSIAKEDLCIEEHKWGQNFTLNNSLWNFTWVTMIAKFGCCALTLKN